MRVTALDHLERAPVTVEDVVGVTPPPQGLAREPVGIPQQHVQQKQPEQNETLGRLNTLSRLPSL